MGTKIYMDPNVFHKTDSKKKNCSLPNCSLPSHVFVKHGKQTSPAHWAVPGTALARSCHWHGTHARA